MPPILNLKNDKKFYGTKDPAPGGDISKLEHPAQPPNPMSNVKLSNKIQRENAVERLTNDINTVDNLESKEKPTNQGELVAKDVEKLKKSNDLGSRLVSFLQTPIVPVSEEAEKDQKKREVARIGLTDDNLAENQVRPVGEVPVAIAQRGMDFIENKFIQVLVILGGIYIAGQVAQGVAKNASNKD